MKKLFCKILIMTFFIFTPFLFAEKNPDSMIEKNEGFVPWYTGPLLAASASCLQTGIWNVQPYLFVQDNYGKYNKNWGFHSQKNTLSIITSCFLQRGVTDWMDLSLYLGTTYNKKDHLDAFDFIDMSMVLAFQILQEEKETLKPNIRCGIKETFPTGKYEKLSSKKNGVDSTGGGAFITTFFLNFSKVQYWWIKHPLSWRLNFNYGFNSDVDVEGFHAYGGGFGTRGTVHLGNIFFSIFSFELSLTQSWVLAWDTAVTSVGKIKFTGYPGINADGTVAVNTQGEQFQISFAPAIEYNLSKNGGFIGGVWFTVGGKNAAAFVSGVLSFTYAF